MMNSHIEKQIHSAIMTFLQDHSLWDISLSGTKAVYQLEQKFTELVEQPYALAVANATSGIWAVLNALEIHNADIITTPYSWAGSLAGLLLTGNRPVFVDIDKLNPNSFNMNIGDKAKRYLDDLLTHYQNQFQMANRRKENAVNYYLENRPELYIIKRNA